MTDQVHANIVDHPAADCFWQQNKINVLMNDLEPCPAPLLGSTLFPIPPLGLPGADSWHCLG